MGSDKAYEAVTRAKNQDSGGNPEGAVKTLEDYLVTDPHNTYVRMELARILTYSLENKQQGLFQLQVVLDIEPDNIDALKASTTVKSVIRERASEADAEFRHLIDMVYSRGDKAEYASVCAAYAIFLRKQMRDYQAAGDYYEKAVTADPDRYEYHQDYAVLLLNEYRDYPKARHELEEVLRLKPNHLSAKKNLDKLVRTKFDSDGNVKLSFVEKMALRKQKKSE